MCAALSRLYVKAIAKHRIVSASQDSVAPKPALNNGNKPKPAVTKVTTSAPRTLRLRHRASIHSEPNGSVIEVWEAGAPLTSTAVSGDWIRISGYFPHRGPWQASERPRWISRHDVNGEVPRNKEPQPRNTVARTATAVTRSAAAAVPDTARTGAATTVAAAKAEPKPKQRAKVHDQAATSDAPFDHFTTGFPLTGPHRVVACESCHRSALFRGTPRQCASCHTRSDIAGDAVKPSDHIASSSDCLSCHDANRWSPVIRVEHASVIGTCASCHNGVSATGKGAGHIATTASCDSCHSTNAWTPTGFDHASATPGQCASCHNGSTATGKDAGHIATTASCDSCHTTRSWLPATMDHGTVSAGTCASCHNGVSATGKPANHLPSGNTCDDCHTTTSWANAVFDHGTAQTHSRVKKAARAFFRGAAPLFLWGYVEYRLKRFDIPVTSVTFWICSTNN